MNIEPFLSSLAFFTCHLRQFIDKASTGQVNQPDKKAGKIAIQEVSFTYFKIQGRSAEHESG